MTESSNNANKAPIRGVRVEAPTNVLTEGSAMHSNGTELRVDGGHLLVRNGARETIAIYAPEQWLRAEYVDE